MQAYTADNFLMETSSTALSPTVSSSSCNSSVAHQTSFLDYSSPQLVDSIPSPDHHSAQHQSFLSMDDLHTPSTSPPPAHAHAQHYFTTASSGSQSSPAPVIVHSKAAKKRKSWGQELPQPKTNLPPRKRAKTDDEKEQRRIERIKRNRAAAHNSRERKRQEAETLAVALAHANAELEAYRRLHGPLPADIILPEVTVVTESADTPVPSLSDSRSSTDESASGPSSPTDSLWHNTIIKQEPTDHALPMQLPLALEGLEGKPSLFALNPTQHSAAMLCDLPCRFSPSSSNSLSSSTRASAPADSLLPATWWATLFLYLHTLQLRNCYQTLLLALSSLSPSLMAHLTQPSLRNSSPSTTTSTIPQLVQTTLRHCALYKTATAQSALHQGALIAPARESVGVLVRSES